MTIKERLLQELEQISESQFPTILNFLHNLKQQNLSSTPIAAQELEVTFNHLVQQWQTETRFLSSTHQMVLHPAYQQIIGMGEAVVPLLLRELEKKSGRWFWALKSITREDPVSPDTRGRTQEMIKVWLDWGRAKGQLEVQHILILLLICEYKGL